MHVFNTLVNWMLQISNFVQINTSQFIKYTGKLSQVILYCITWVNALFIH